MKKEQFKHLINIKVIIYLIFIFAIVGCRNKILFKKDNIVIEKKFYFSKDNFIDTAYLKLLKTQKWNLLFYTEGNKRKINIVDTNLISFQFVNDTIVNYSVYKDSSFQLIISNFFDYLQIAMGNSDFVKGTMFVVRTKSSLHYAFIKFIHPSLLIIDFEKHNPNNSKVKQRYRLCFQGF